jgi:CMP-N-acetylneuraminic acid synthetase
MAEHNVSIFIPLRKGSERSAGKNYKKFSSCAGGLIELKLRQVIDLRVDEVIVSTNDEEVVKVAKKFIPLYQGKLRIIERPENLCLSSTPVKDLIAYVPTVVRTDHVLWLHVTSPLFNTYRELMGKYWDMLGRGYDSLITVTEFKEFLMDKTGTIVNGPPDVKWPRTQDLDPLFIVNHAAYMSSVENYKRYEDRVGKHPYLYDLGKVRGIDVDYDDDFLVAEALFNMDPNAYTKTREHYE